MVASNRKITPGVYRRAMKKPELPKREVFYRFLRKRSETEVLNERYGVRFHDPEADRVGGNTYTWSDIRELERERMPRRRRR